jgi:hypothetical protein
MNAIWLVRSRELASRLRFWTAIVGYDPRDHSLSHRLYLFYVVIFFSLWGFSILVLLADAGKWILSFIQRLPPTIAVVVMMAAGLLFDAVFRSYKACRRSPFVFSEEDAALLCQTPVDRRQVALVWLLGDWLLACLPFVILGVILCFSSLQLAEPGPFLWTFLPRYWFAAFRVTSIILPLHLALMAGAFALGSLRLQGARDNRALSWIPVGFVLVIFSLAYFNRSFLEIILSPVIFPLKAGYSLENWLLGFILVLTLALAGLLALYYDSPRLNLSRAAQETLHRWDNPQLSLLGASRLTRQMKIRNRLGFQHTPSCIPGREGAWSLVWKEIVISLRSVNFAYLVTWLAIFGLSVSMVIAPDWGTRFWAFIIWCWLVGHHCTERLRADLELWVISRQLPFSGRVVMAADLAIPAIVSLNLIWLAIIIAFGMGFSFPIYLILLAPMMIISVVLAASHDILRKCQSSDLLDGQVAEPGAIGLLFGALLAGIPMIAVYWLTNQISSPGVNLVIVLFLFVLGLGVSYMMWKLIASTYHGIK